MRRVLSTVMLVVAFASGCSDSQTTTSVDPALAMPCDEPATELRLGTPYRGSRLAEFTVNTTPAWVTVVDMDESGILEYPSGTLYVYVGDAATRPVYNAQTSTVTNVTVRLHVHEDDFSRLDIDPGRYWLWQSRGGTAIVASCEEDGVSDPDAA